MADDVWEKLKKIATEQKTVTGGDVDDATRAAALKRGADALGVNPEDYATAISYESARTFDPWVKGPVTKWGQHRGTIQYGEPQRRKYGVHENQSFEEQVADSNVRYLKDAGVKPGMTFAQLYKAINAGNVNANENIQDANTGRTVGDNIRNAERDHREEVRKRFGSFWNAGASSAPAVENDAEKEKALLNLNRFFGDKKPPATTLEPTTGPSTQTVKQPQPQPNIQAPQTAAPPTQPESVERSTLYPQGEIDQLSTIAESAKRGELNPYDKYEQWRTQYGVADTQENRDYFNAENRVKSEYDQLLQREHALSANDAAIKKYNESVRAKKPAAGQKTGQAIPDAVELPAEWRQVSKLASPEEIGKSGAGTFRVDLRGVQGDRSRAAARAALYRLAPKVGASFDKIDQFLDRRGGNYFAQGKVDGDYADIEIPYSVLSDIAGPEAVKKAYLEDEAAQRMSLYTSDAPVAKDEWGNPMTRSEVAGAISVRAAEEQRARKQIEDAAIETGLNDDGSLSLTDTNNWKLAVGAMLTPEFWGSGRAEITEDQRQAVVRQGVDELIKTAGSARQAAAIAREYDQMSGLEKTLRHGYDFGSVIAKAPASFAKTIAWAEDSLGYLRENGVIIPTLTATDLMNGIGWLTAKTFGVEDKQFKQGEVPIFFAKAIEKAIPDDPKTANTIIGKLSRAAGSSVPFLVGAALTGGSTLAIATMGIGMQAGDMYSEAKDAGLSREKQLLSGLAGVPIGASEIFGLKWARLGQLIEQKSGGVFLKSFLHYITETGKEATEETLQEYFQSAAGSLTKAALTNNGLTRQDIANAAGGSLDDAATGGFIGLLFGGGTPLAAHAAGVIEARGRERNLNEEIPETAIPSQPTSVASNEVLPAAEAPAQPTQQHPAVTQPVQKVPERPVTLDAQRDAMLDMEQPSAMGVLYTHGETPAKDKSSTILKVETDEGMLHVNSSKLKPYFEENVGKWNKEEAVQKIQSSEIPLTDIIGGKAVEMENTAGGTSVVTVDAEGNELNATKISDNAPESLTPEEQKLVEGQRKLDTERFGERATNTATVPTEEVANARKESRPIQIANRPKANRLVVEPRKGTSSYEIAKELQNERGRRINAERAAEIDDLTGVANRKALNKALPAAEADANTSVIAFDANNFGKINKEVGQEEGDKALVDVANAIKQAAEESGVNRYFRRGGDEFVVLAPKAKADAIRARAEELYGEKKYGTTAVSISGTVGNTFAEADSTLQAAKAERKKAAVAETPEFEPSGKSKVPRLNPQFPAEQSALKNQYPVGTELKHRTGGKSWKVTGYIEDFGEKGNTGVKLESGSDKTIMDAAELADKFVTTTTEVEKEATPEKTQPKEIKKPAQSIATPKEVDVKAISAKPKISRADAFELAKDRFTTQAAESEGDEFYSSAQMRVEHKGQQFLFNTSEVAKAVGIKDVRQRLNYYQKPAAAAVVLRKKKTDTEAEFLYKTLPYAHIEDVLDGATGGELHDNGELELSLHDGELARRILAEVEFQDSHHEVDQAVFEGIVIDADTLRKMAAVGRSSAKLLAEHEYTDKQIEAMTMLADNLGRLASRAKDFGIAYIFDESLGEERFHVKDLRAGRTDLQAENEIESDSEIFKNPGDTFSRHYGNENRADKISEIIAKLATGQESEFGWDKMPDFEAERDKIRKIWADGVIRRNTDENGRLDPNLFQNFREIAEYAYFKTADKGRSRSDETPEDRNRSDDAGPSNGGETGERDTGVSGEQQRTEEDQSADSDAAEESGFAPGGKEKLSQTPISLREKANIPAKDRIYTSTTNAERQNFANEQLDQGVDAAQKWVKTQLDDNNLNSGATAVVGINVLNQLGKQGRIDELNKFAEKLIPVITEAAQTVQAMSIVNMFSPETAAAYLAKIAKKNHTKVTQKDLDKAQDIAERMSETVKADAIANNAVAEIEKENAAIKKDLDDATKALEIANGKVKQQGIKMAGLSRTVAALKNKVEGVGKVRTSKEVTEKLKDIASRKDDILANIRAQYGAAILRSVAYGSRIKLRSTNEPSSPVGQDLIDYATLHLADNLGKITVQQFKDAINALTNGKLTADQLSEIHAEAVNALRTAGKSAADDIKAANRLRRDHYRAADQYNAGKFNLFGFKTGNPVNKFVSAVITTGVQGEYSDESIWFALARKEYPDREDAVGALKKEFPDLTTAQYHKIMADAHQLTVEVRQVLKDGVDQRQNDWTLNKEDLALVQEEKRFNSHEKQRIAREAGRFYEGLVKSKSEVALDTLVNFRRVNLLTGIKTHFVNILGNAGNLIGESMASVPASIVDTAAAMFTNERTVSPSASSVINGFRSIFKQDTALKALDKDSGINAAKHIWKHGGSQEDLERLQHSDSTLSEKFEGKIPKIIDGYINTVFRSLGAEDAVFKVYAFRKHIQTQARAIALTEKRSDRTLNVKKRTQELVNSPTQLMMQKADDFAHLMTFQNDNALSSFIGALKRGRPLVKAGIETLMPYDRTPTNIVLRTLEYTPLGVAAGTKQLFNKIDNKFRNQYTGAIRADLDTAAFEALSNTEQRELIEQGLQKAFKSIKQEQFARIIGRSAMGTALFSLGFGLAALGLMAGAMSFDDDDKKESDEFEKRKRQGIENGSIYIPGVGRFVLPKSPPTAVLTAGATFYEQMMLSKKPAAMAAIGAGSEAFSDIFAEQPLINSTYQTYRALSKGKVGEFAGNILSGYVPASAMVRSISDVTDDTDRAASGYRIDRPRKNDEIGYQIRGFRNSLIRGIPWLRTYADESTLQVSPEERGGVLRRVARAVDPFNIRSGRPYHIEVQQTPASPEEFIKSKEFKRLDTNMVVDTIKMAREDGEDTKALEEALKQKAKNASKRGSLTSDEVEKIKTVLPDFSAPPAKPTTEKIFRMSTDKVVEYYQKNQGDMGETARKAMLDVIREKAKSASKKKMLTSDELKTVQEVLPDFQTKTNDKPRPVSRGLGRFKRRYGTLDVNP